MTRNISIKVHAVPPEERSKELCILSRQFSERNPATRISGSRKSVISLQFVDNLPQVYMYLVLGVESTVADTDVLRD